MHISEEAILPTREWEKGHRSCHANVDADIACQRLMAEFACRGAAAREKACHVTVGGVIHHLNGLIDSLHMHQAEHRPENLGTGDLAARIDVIEYRWADEVAPLVAGDRSRSAHRRALQLARSYPSRLTTRCVVYSQV